MKKINGCLLIILIVLVFVSCKKDIHSSNEVILVPTSKNIQDLKTWYTPRILGRDENSNSGILAMASNPDWEGTKVYENGNVFVTPLKNKNLEHSFSFLESKMSTSGELFSGKLCTLITPESKTFTELDRSEMLEVLTLKKVPGAVSGILVVYDLTNNDFVLRKIENGIIDTVQERNFALNKPKIKTQTLRTSSGVLVDWYLQTYINGALVDEVYLYSSYLDDGTDMPITDNLTGPNASSDAEIIEMFNNYTQRVSNPATVDASVTSQQTDPISGTFEWTVAQGAIANWSVRATTAYSYYHDMIYNIPTSSVESRYNITNFHTINTRYIGSNFAVLTTWTQGAVNDIVFNNGTANANGKSQVVGTLYHKLKVPLPGFLSNAVPELSDDVNNYVIWNPR